MWEAAGVARLAALLPVGQAAAHPWAERSAQEVAVNPLAEAWAWAVARRLSPMF